MAEKVINPINTFFSRTLEEKESFQGPGFFGYSNVEHKESFRWLTGSRFEDHQKRLPEEISQMITELTIAMDKIMIDLVTVLAKPLFQTDLLNLAKQCDLPLLLPNDSTNKSFGMMDIAHYMNSPQLLAKTKLPPGINCAPHHDPGLISLSILSTAPGLQLFDPVTGEWLEHTGEDKSVGVIWCGSAAKEVTNGVIKPGLHRVSTYEGQKRIALWYEVCKRTQENHNEELYKIISVLTPQTDSEKDTLEINEKDNTDINTDISNEVKIRRLSPKKLYFEEYDFGVPMSKSDRTFTDRTEGKKIDSSLNIDGIWVQLKNIFDNAGNAITSFINFSK